MKSHSEMKDVTSGPRFWQASQTARPEAAPLREGGPRGGVCSLHRRGSCSHEGCGGDAQTRGQQRHSDQKLRHRIAG